MFKKLLYLIFLVLCFKETKAQVLADSISIKIGEKHTLHSNILNEERPYWIYLPPDYNNKTYAPAKYPVVYLLDGDMTFHAFTGIMQYLSKLPYPLIPQMIVVGIPNTNRTRDLTPSKAGRTAYFNKEEQLYKDSGGNDDFFSFIKDELNTAIEKKYRTNGYRILVGHSFGGLTVINALLKQSSFFNAFVAIDPSLWWDNELMKKEFSAIPKNRDFSGKSLFIARANKTLTPQDTTTDMQRSILAFQQSLENNSLTGLRYKTQFYQNEDHGTISVPAAYDALKFIFDGYLIQVKQAVFQPAIVSESFKKLSLKHNFRFDPPESYLDWMGNYATSIGQKENALKFFQMNLDLYPQSLNAKKKVEGLAR